MQIQTDQILSFPRAASNAAFFDTRGSRSDPESARRVRTDISAKRHRSVCTAGLPFRVHPQTSRLCFRPNGSTGRRGEPKRASRPKCEPSSNSTSWMKQEER